MHRDSRAAVDRRRLGLWGAPGRLGRALVAGDVAPAGLLLALLLGSAWLVACGGAEERASGLSVRFADRGILAESAGVAFYFFTDTATTGQCSAVRAQFPRPRSVLGPFRAELSAEAQQNGLTFSLDTVPVGTYVVLADALDAAGLIVGTGCAEGQRVYNRQRSGISIVISRNPQ